MHQKTPKMSQEFHISLCKYLFDLDNKKISNLEIPTGNPLLIEIEKEKIKNASYLDKDRAKGLLVF